MQIELKFIKSSQQRLILIFEEHIGVGLFVMMPLVYFVNYHFIKHDYPHNKKSTRRC